MINVLYKIKKVNSINSKAVYMQTPTKWDTEGKFFTAKQILNLLAHINKNLQINDKLPDWEVVEYQVIETTIHSIDKFVKVKSSSPWIRGI